MAISLENYQSVLLALALYREARGCSDDAKLAVAWAIRNRSQDPRDRWPKTISGVILQRWQFSSFNPDSTDAVFPVPPDAAWDSCCSIVDGLEASTDPTAGAQFYHSIPYGQVIPRWAQEYPLTTTIGPFRFYRQP